eukprot:252717_1
MASGAKYTDSGEVIGGYASCNPHTFVAQPIDILQSLFNPVTSAKPQEVKVPALQLRNAAFDENKQRVKLVFKVRQDANDNKDLDINVMDHLYIHVLCQQKMHDHGKTDELKLIY